MNLFVSKLPQSYIKAFAAILFILGLFSANPCNASSVMENFDHRVDHLSQNLTIATPNHNTVARLSGQQYFEYKKFFHPRTTLNFDLQTGSTLYTFARWQLDRGYHPDQKESYHGRLNELAIRITPITGRKFNVQIGQFTTVFGQWIKRHSSWDNAFIRSPLIYDHATGISDRRVNYSTYSLINSSRNSSYDYNPVIWGPAYATGIAFSGIWSTIHWSFEIKNASLMSNPQTWRLSTSGFQNPTVNSRIAWRPDMRWNFGLSTSRGRFPANDITYAIPSGYNRSDYQQEVVMIDISYAHRHLQIWGEWALARYDLPMMQRLYSHAYFIEARYRLTPRFSAAVRWNQQFFSTIHQYAVPVGKWGLETERIDISATYRLSAYTKIQAEMSGYSRSPSTNREQLVFATRVTLRF